MGRPGSRVNHEPEDLLGELTVVPSRLGSGEDEEAGAILRVYSGLGDFSFEPMASISPRHEHVVFDGAVGVSYTGR